MKIHVSGVKLFFEKQAIFCGSLVKDFLFSKRHKGEFYLFLEMCAVQHAQTKIMFTFQPKKLPVSKTVKSENPAVTCRTFLLGTKSRQLCLVVRVHNDLQELLLVTMKKTVAIFEKNIVRLSNTPNIEPKKAKILPCIT